jgi:NADPH-dependent 7-cyano-7-deazaguanine reductase QueF
VSPDTALLRTLPEEAEVAVVATGFVTHRCPLETGPHQGEVTISWRCEGTTIELGSLVAYLASWTANESSHEELTARVCLDLCGLDGIEAIEVESRWSNAGLSVTVRS